MLASIYNHAYLKILRVTGWKLQTYHFIGIKIDDIELILEPVVLISSKQYSSEVTDAVQSEVTGGGRSCSLNDRSQPQLCKKYNGHGHY